MLPRQDVSFPVLHGCVWVWWSSYLVCSFCRVWCRKHNLLSVRHLFLIWYIWYGQLLLPFSWGDSILLIPVHGGGTDWTFLCINYSVQAIFLFFVSFWNTFRTILVISHWETCWHVAISEINGSSQKGELHVILECYKPSVLVKYAA